MKAIIVEDSRLARVELLTLLQAHPEVEVVGEAANAEEAKILLSKTETDLLFLDIQLPGANGFELLEALDEVPVVIFTTAYDAYALKSFEYNALDYLLKPIKPERLARAIEKALAQQIQRQSGAERLDLEHRIFVKDGERCWIVRLGDIRILEVYGNYTRIYFEDQRPLVLRSLNYLEERLQPDLFFRVNRQQLVNVRFIAGVDNALGGQLRLRLNSGEIVEVSRRQALRLRELLRI